MSVVFDIETGPLSMDRLKEVLPPFAPTAKDPGEFDESTVKLGVMKDAEKIRAKIEECRAKHAAAVAEYQDYLSVGEEQYWQSVMDRAALSATTGQVLAIGYHGSGKSFIDSVDPQIESNVISRFWAQFVKLRSGGRSMIGFNCNDFDVPFLVQRSIILGIDLPENLLEGGKWLSRTFVDLRSIWSAGSRSSPGTLDLICRCAGLGAKTDGVSGADFSRLFSNPETRQQALDYLSNDLAMTAGLARRVGLM